MSEPNDSTRLDPLQPFVEYWTSYVRQTNEATQALLGAQNAGQFKAWQRQWLDAVSKGMDEYLRSPFFLQMLKARIDRLIETKPLACSATPHEVVYEAGTLRLLHYRGPASSQWREPILICFALVNRPYILDLQEGRSVVQRLLESGFDVYLIDWGAPTAEDCTLRLQDYVCRLLKDVVEFTCRHADSPQLNLLGYCMGGTMATMYTALFPQHVRNLILLAAPVDFSSDDALLNIWAREEYFDVDGLIDRYGNCPGWFLQPCFQLIRPVQNYVEKYMTFYEKMDDEAFRENFYAMEHWANDNIPVAGETFREFVKWLYRQDRLVKGELSLDGAAVKLDAITCPLLMLVAVNDHLVPPSSTLPLKDRVASQDVESMSIDAGHVGLAVSSKAHRQFWPEATQWIAQRCTAAS